MPDIVQPETMALGQWVAGGVGKAYPLDVVEQRRIGAGGIPQINPVPHEAAGDDVVYGGRNEAAAVNKMAMPHFLLPYGGVRAVAVPAFPPVVQTPSTWIDSH